MIRASALVAAAACARGPAATEPQIRATVLTIRTTLQPQNARFEQTVAIAAGRARSSDELDRWRLFDFRTHRVLLVDDVSRTFSWRSFEETIERRRAAASQPLPVDVPVAEVDRTGGRRVLHGIATSPLQIRVGAYRRTLWIAEIPEVPPELFSLMSATEPADPRYEPMMREADEAILAVRGFPLADHAELPLGDSTLVADRAVIRIEQRDVPRSWLQVSAAYRDLTPPGANRPPAASPPSGRSVPEGGSRSSSTGRTDP